jgi:protein-tyrosine kinase
MNNHRHALHSIQYTHTRITAIDPEVLRRNRIVMGLHNEPRSDIFRVLRTNILRQLRENDWNSFAVTSATPSAGKTFVSVNLALAMALEGNQSVLLVDGDFRRPAIAQSLGLPAERGLVDCLTGEAVPEEVLINPGIDRLIILPGRHSSINSSELIASPGMAASVQEMKSRYESRIVIFDIPPLFVADDALLFMPYIDGVVLVAEDEKNTAEELQSALHILEHANILGIILNKSRVPLAVPYYY